MKYKIINPLPFPENYIAVRASALDLFFKTDARLIYFMLFQSRHKAQYHTISYPKFQMIQELLEDIRTFILQVSLLLLNLSWKYSKYLNIISCWRRVITQRQHSLFYTNEF